MQKIKVLELFIDNGFINKNETISCILNNRHITPAHIDYVCFCKGVSCKFCSFEQTNKIKILGSLKK